jgi:hypothetical protein
MSKTNNKKAEYHGQKLGHSKGNDNPDPKPFRGADSRTTPDTPSQFGATVHSQHVSQDGASPNRARFSEPKLIKENGSTHIAHVTNIPKEESSQTKADAETDKLKLFSRPSSGNGEAMPRPGMSNRSYSSTGAKAPNQEEK